MTVEDRYLSEKIVLPVHNTLFDTQRECLFIYKAKGQPDIQLANETTSQLSTAGNELNGVNGHNEEDFVGMPLECPFDINVLKQSDDLLLPTEISKSLSFQARTSGELHFKPFSGTEARSILNDISLKQSKLPVFVLCDGAEPQKTTLVGEESDQRTTVAYEVTTDGPISIKHKDIQLENLKQRMSFYCNNNSYKVLVNAEYSAYQSETLDEEDLISKSYMRLAFSWENPRKILETPSSPTGAITVTLRLAYGESSSPNNNLWNQLKALRNFVTGVKNEEIVWIGDAQHSSLIHEVDKLLTGSFEDHWQAKSCFTNQLWELLSLKCSSSQTLLETLNYVLRKTRQENILITTGWNKTKLGTMLTDMSREIQLTNDAEPLRLLIDTGIQKLKDDYIDFLAGQALISETELLQFLPKDGADMEDSLQRLEAALYTIEALTLCHRILKLDFLSLKFVVMPLLKHYSQKKELDFTFQINAAMLPYFFENKSVNAEQWRIQFVSNDPEYSVKFVCLLRPTPNYPNPDDEIKLENGPVDPLVNVEYLLSIQC